MDTKKLILVIIVGIISLGVYTLASIFATTNNTEKRLPPLSPSKPLEAVLNHFL